MEYNIDSVYCKLPDDKIYLVNYKIETPFENEPTKIRCDAVLENGNIDKSGEFNGTHDICKNLVSDRNFIIINNEIFYLDELKNKPLFEKGVTYEAYKDNEFYGFAECLNAVDVIHFKVTHRVDEHSKLITMYYPKVNLYRFSKTGVLFLSDEIYINFKVK